MSPLEEHYRQKTAFLVGRKDLIFFFFASRSKKGSKQKPQTAEHPFHRNHFSGPLGFCRWHINLKHWRILTGEGKCPYFHRNLTSTRSWPPQWNGSFNCTTTHSLFVAWSMLSRCPRLIEFKETTHTLKVLCVLKFSILSKVFISLLARSSGRVSWIWASRMPSAEQKGQLTILILALQRELWKRAGEGIFPSLV